MLEGSRQNLMFKIKTRQIGFDKISAELKARILWFAALLTIGGISYVIFAYNLLVSESDMYSHVPITFAISGYVLFRERGNIFKQLSYSFAAGGGCVIAAAVMFILGNAAKSGLSQNDYFSAVSFAFVLYLTGSFILCFGAGAFRRGAFPVLLLLFAVPIPDFVMSRITWFLQVMSFWSAAGIMDFLGLYPIREGFTLSFPGLTIEVAEQCSGIRSSLALMLMSLLYMHYFLRKYPSKVVLVAASLFIIPFKNGLRIAVLVLLSIYWDRRFLSGPLHTYGGIPFFGIGIAWLSLLTVILAKAEKYFSRSRS